MWVPLNNPPPMSPLVMDDGVLDLIRNSPPGRVMWVPDTRCDDTFFRRLIAWGMSRSSR
jgi:hypothetical protein